MGTPKAALAVGPTGETFVSRLVSRLRDAHVPDIVVVTGAADEPVRRAAGRVRSTVRFVHNDRWKEGQLTSLLAGLAPRHGDVVEGALVLLVDTPLVAASTIRSVIATWRRTRAAIVRPSRRDEHGHPVLFDSTLFADLRAADPSIGAKAVVRAHAHAIVNVPVDDDGAFVDIDTPADYTHVMRELRN